MASGTPTQAGPVGTAAGETPLERVEAELCTLAGQIAAATCRFLVLLGDFDAREGWAGWNVRSCAQWLSWRCALDLRTAREYVRVARALRQLPKTRAAFGGGRISYSRCARSPGSPRRTPSTTSSRRPGARRPPRSSGSPGAFRAWSGSPPATPPRPAARPRRGKKHCGGAGTTTAPWSCGAGSAPSTAPRCWPPSPAPRSCAHPAAPRTPRTPSPAASPPPGGVPRNRPGDITPVPPANAAAALVTMAQVTRDAVAAPTHAPVADVIVHVEAATLAAADGEGEPADGTARLDDGPAIPGALARRLACDGRIQLAVRGPDGRTLDLGRRRRRPTARQKAALWRRDRGCAVPGCTRTRFLHAHHVKAWARGGATSLDNLVLLCGQHHRALHDGQFAIVALGRQRFRFHGPNGATYPTAPPLRGFADGVAAAHPDIRPDTIAPDWAGFGLDLHHAVATYLQNWQLEERQRARAAAS